jgi:RecA-family ATPase
MDQVIRIFAEIADVQSCAIGISHHMLKMAIGVDVDYDVSDMRGASAIKDAARAVRVLNRMAKSDANNAGVLSHERSRYIRVDRAKGNNSKATAARWLTFADVTIANGDEVGVLVPWQYSGQAGPPSEERDRAEQMAEHVFLTFLARYLQVGRRVSESSGKNYAPSLFAEEREAKMAKVSKAALKGAMDRLFEKGLIKVDTKGSGGKASRAIALA